MTPTSPTMRTDISIWPSAIDRRRSRPSASRGNGRSRDLAAVFDGPEVPAARILEALQSRKALHSPRPLCHVLLPFGRSTINPMLPPPPSPLHAPAFPPAPAASD